jgi:hypothetical protein
MWGKIMTEFKETVTTSKNKGTDRTGARVQQQTRKIDTEVTADGKSTAANIVWYILGTIEIMLAFRFALKLFGANPSSGFVDFVYSVSGVLTAPFDSIFNTATTKTSEIQSVFEPSILVAAAVYALIAWGIVKLININQND